MARSDISFCPCSGSDLSKANIMATAVSARVDIYRLPTPAAAGSGEEDEDGIKPIQRLFKFKDVTTAVQMRQDGNIALCGEKNGRVQLIELSSNKFVLKTY